MLVGVLLVHSALDLVYECPLGSRLSPLEGGVTIVQLPLFPIVPSTLYRWTC